MRSPLRRLGRHYCTVAALAGAVALAAPALAGAKTYCVGNPGGDCDVSNQGGATGLQEALTEAQASPASDEVRIGEGTYTGNFTYGSSYPVRIQGTGTGTVIEGADGSPALQVLGTNVPLTIVSDLEIRMASVGQSQPAIGLRIGPGIAERVRVTNPGNSKGTAVMFATGGDIADSAIVAGQATGIDDDGYPSTHDVRDTVIRAGVGVRARHGVWRLDRAAIEATIGGVASYTDVTSVRNSLIRVSGLAGSPLTSTALHQGDEGQLTAEHVTILGGPDLTYGVLASAPTAATSLRISLRNSIVAGGDASSFACTAVPGGSPQIMVGFSNFAPPDSVATGACAPFQETAGTNSNVPPRFVDALVTPTSPTVNLRLRHDSPLIDHGDPGVALDEDLAREDRVVDGDGDHIEVPDMGAYEYQRRPPIAVIAAPATGAVAAGAPIAFSAQGSSDPDAADAWTAAYQWSFGDGATATGLTANHTYTAPGPRTVTLTVTDPTGLTAMATRTLVVEGPPPSPGTATPPPSAGEQPSAAQRDGVAPAVSGLSLTPRDSRVGAAGRRPSVRFTLSEAATVRFAIARRAPGRRVKQACRRPDRRNRARPGCARWVAVGGFMRRASAGANGLRLRVHGPMRSLPPGRYRLTLVATDAAGNRSVAARTPFGVVRCQSRRGDPCRRGRDPMRRPPAANR